MQLQRSLPAACVLSSELSRPIVYRGALHIVQLDDHRIICRAGNCNARVAQPWHSSGSGTIVSVKPPWPISSPPWQASSLPWASTLGEA